MTVITMVVRLDVFSVIYGVFLGVLVLLSRRCCYRLWPGYIIILMILLVIQYLSCVGLPLSLCWGLLSFHHYHSHQYVYLNTFSITDLLTHSNKDQSNLAKDDIAQLIMTSGTAHIALLIDIFYHIFARWQHALQSWS